MRKYLEKKENDVCYIAEGYNVEKMKADSFNNITAGSSAGRKMIRSIGDGFTNPIYGIKWMDKCVVYAACEKDDVQKLEDYIIVDTIGKLIGKGGAFWSKYTSVQIGCLIEEEIV